MKKLFGTYLNGNKNSPTQPMFPYLRLEIPVVLLFIVLLSGCSKQQQETQAKDAIVKADNAIMNSDDEFQNAYKNEINSGNNETSRSEGFSSHGFSFITFLELLEARAATAKYRDFDKAIADGYADINVVVPNMGYHFLKSAIADARFEIKKPEILVYNKKRNGSFELVAVEYAVPISVTPNAAPEGFTGSADVWERNTDFGLWLQHAWIWKFNPDGVFHDTNPLVHLR
ncbi:MAG: hypothetical protein ABI402_13345 [Ferruginibacter sp.]